ncbi:radical SAM protein [Candidatus Micrarchaeota archaeon]|nr:radical SAM protein [Candidatus Micrarchaeota archaeon]
MRRLGKTPAPKTVVWECTLACNMQCVHCGAYSNKKFKELSTEKMFFLLDELSSYGVERFAVTGGEPLLRKDTLDILARAKKIGFSTGLSTNGFFVSDENARKIADSVDSVQVSIDGIGRTHDLLRRKSGSFIKAANALRVLKKHNCKQVCMTSIISPLNLDELNGLYDLARQNADLWRIGTVMPIGRASKNNELILSREQLTKLLKFIAETPSDFLVLLGENLGYLGKLDSLVHKRDFFFCGAGILSCCIGIDGKVRGCPELPSTSEFIEGDLAKDSFADIWENGFRDYRNEAFSKIPDDCISCSDLDLCRGGCQVMRLRNLHCTKKRLGLE